MFHWANNHANRLHKHWQNCTTDSEISIENKASKGVLKHNTKNCTRSIRLYCQDTVSNWSLGKADISWLSHLIGNPIRRLCIARHRSTPYNCLLPKNIVYKLSLCSKASYKSDSWKLTIRMNHITLSMVEPWLIRFHRILFLGSICLHSEPYYQSVRSNSCNRLHWSKSDSRNGMTHKSCSRYYRSI